MKTSFPPISDNLEKSATYKSQLERFKLAREQGFYFEGIFILFAMMEDRLSSFLFYAGMSNCNRDKVTTNPKVRPQLNAIFLKGDWQKNALKGISYKIDLIQHLLAWSRSYIFADPSNDYQDMLAKQISQTYKADEMITTLGEIKNWCKSRNELVHALLNKNLVNQAGRLQLLVEVGYAYTRQLDKFVRSFKNHNTIRKQFNIQ